MKRPPVCLSPSPARREGFGFVLGPDREKEFYLKSLNALLALEERTQNRHVCE